MKGKYANAAEKRRGMDELEARVSAAEQQREAAGRQLAEGQERARREIDTLKTRLKVVTAERDAVSSPALAAALDQYRELQAEMRDFEEEYGRLRNAYEKLMNGTHRWLMEATGCTGAEALERITHMVGLSKIHASASDGISQQFLAEAHRSPERLAQVLTLQRVHGRRRLPGTALDGDAEQ